MNWTNVTFAALALVGIGLHPTAAAAAHITSPALHFKAATADEATDSFHPSDPVQCDLILEGPIEEGDAGELRNQFAQIVGNANAFSFFLCLRSPGGSIKEALRIADYVRKTQRPSIATVIEDGQTCASACALIFLAGNAPARVGAFPQRFLHPRGRLLYHSSRLDLGGFSNDTLLTHLTKSGGDLKGNVAQLYEDGIQDVQSTMNTFKGTTFQREVLGPPWVRPSLFLEMFAQDPNEWICIDDVDSAGRWNIQVFGYEPPKTLKAEHHENLCRNAFHWRADEFASRTTDIETIEESVVKWPAATQRIGGRLGPEDGKRFTLHLQAPMSQLMCVGETLTSGENTIGLDATVTAYFADSEGEERISEILELAPFAYLSAETILRDLPGVRPAGTAPVAASTANFRRFQNSLMNGCSFKRLANVTLDACQEACGLSGECKAYSYNRMTQRCELKHTLTALRLDPMWISGAPATGLMPKASVRPVVMSDYELDLIGIDGELIETVANTTDDICNSRCDSDPACFATVSDPQAESCRRYGAISGFIRKSNEPDFKFVYIKRQK